LILISTLVSQAQKAPLPIKLSKRTLVNGVKINMPKDFTPMIDDDIVVRYLTHKKPLAMYTSEDRNVGFGFNVATVNWEFNDLVLLKKFYKATVLSMFTKVDLINEGITVINGNEYAFLEFTSQVDRIKNYFYVQYLVVNNRIFIFHLMCPSPMSKQWAPVAREMMSSAQVNASKLNHVKMHKQKEQIRKGIPEQTDPRPKNPKDKPENVPTFK
jgi:hypothetical protein